MKISILLLIFLSVFAGKTYSNDTSQAVNEFYTDPGSNAYKWVGLNGGSANAETIRTHIAERAGGKWYGTQHDQPWDVQPVGEYVSDAAAVGQIPILVAYNMYQRDCGGESNGGASSKQSYKAWIDDFASAIGDRKALVVLEPDALTQYLVCSNIDKPARQELLAYAVNSLATKTTNAQVYLDAGNAEWPGDASSIAAALQEAGVEKIEGFALNVSNHYETYKSYDRAGTINHFLGTRAGYVVDTSRNGAGKTDTSENSWCNPRGARLGEHSRYTPEGPADAVLWLKVPGDSDGSCNYGEGIPAGQFSEKLAMALITGEYDE
ncbi:MULTISPECIES: glycoside hydrolase family 6 protein [unclassified Microbulbifer]|uniref:glycoside hydrolase family 6 protein n=1 Tax=unclassified Microbulbifer TaxID=2619833 RepID=UPI0027E40DA2|nr:MULTISPECIES: glycoside hydrolase family 6 protein [unclassified Microbulbifer]